MSIPLISLHADECIYLEYSDCQDGIPVKGTPMVYEIIYNGDIDSPFFPIEVCIYYPDNIKADSSLVVISPGILTGSPVFLHQENSLCIQMHIDSAQLVAANRKIGHVGFVIKNLVLSAQSSVQMNDVNIYSNLCTTIRPWLLDNLQYWLTPNGTPWLLE